ncbi:unnamed protein product [Polarella glacialis]|uniref:Uncharacterized protein n=1 Tax=Polarella glacialis TaxID=89957 RepID=A0A813IZC0_POLGL|nr:unnamed protein product [Polarella glacialis]
MKNMTIGALRWKKLGQHEIKTSNKNKNKNNSNSNKQQPQQQKQQHKKQQQQQQHQKQQTSHTQAVENKRSASTTTRITQCRWNNSRSQQHCESLELKELNAQLQNGGNHEC